MEAGEEEKKKKKVGQIDVEVIVHPGPDIDPVHHRKRRKVHPNEPEEKGGNPATAERRAHGH